MGDVLKLGPHDSLEIRFSAPEALEIEANSRPLGSPLPAEEWSRTLDSLFAGGGAIAEGREVDFGALREEYADVFRLAA